MNIWIVLQNTMQIVNVAKKKPGNIRPRLLRPLLGPDGPPQLAGERSIDQVKRGAFAPVVVWLRLSGLTVAVHGGCAGAPGDTCRLFVKLNTLPSSRKSFTVPCSIKGHYSGYPPQESKSSYSGCHNLLYLAVDVVKQLANEPLIEHPMK
jgi:hypothetical protein